MLKNLTLFRITAATQAVGGIEEAMQAYAFLPCGSTQRQSTGWTPPRAEGGQLLESVGGQWIAELMTERRVLPAEVVKRRTEELADKIEAETGRRPRGKAMRELKDQAELELLPQAFTKRTTLRIWIDPERCIVGIGTTSATRASDAAGLLVNCMPGVQVQPLTTPLSPVSAMAAWLADKEAPAGFSIDRECELQQPDGERSTVRYGRHTLDIDEVGEHIRQGKLPKKLALTFDGRISFVLTESGVLKKISVLDVALESGPKDVDAFDADVAIWTGELRKLLPHLIEALGGEMVEG